MKPFFLVIPVLLTMGSFLPEPVWKGNRCSGSLDIGKISAVMLTRQVQQGKSVTLKGQIYYQRNGNMVTHFVYPKEYVVIANKLGETKIYDPMNNTVMQYQNFLFSTQSSQFYYFFSGKIADMGLTQIGYVQDRTYNENGMLVTEWKLKKPDKRPLIQRIKIVYDGPQPIYMHYQDRGGKVFRKVYYYNYQHLEDTIFPATTTEIVYGNQGDSTVSKTSYTDFRIDQPAAGDYYEFSIPANAKIDR